MTSDWILTLHVGLVTEGHDVLRELAAIQRICVPAGTIKTLVRSYSLTSFSPTSGLCTDRTSRPGPSPAPGSAGRPSPSGASSPPPSPPSPGTSPHSAWPSSPRRPPTVELTRMRRGYQCLTTRRPMKLILTPLKRFIFMNPILRGILVVFCSRCVVQ